MKFSVSSSATALIAPNVKEQIEAFYEAGIKHIDFGFTSSYFWPDRKACDDETFNAIISQAKKSAEKLGVDFTMGHAPYLYSANESDEKFILQVDDVKGAISACPKPGIDRLAVHAGNAFCECYGELIDKNTAYYKALLPFAEEYGVMLMVENISEKIYNRPFAIQCARDILNLRESLGNHPLIRACWDTGHANVQGVRPI